jgi:anaphase-promoting complex subunit 8
MQRPETLDYDHAEEEFEALYGEFPYMMDYVDFYSNVLYVMEKKAKLSYLAHKCVQVDKYRPETCCVIGYPFLYCGMRLIS